MMNCGENFIPHVVDKFSNIGRDYNPDELTEFIACIMNVIFSWRVFFLSFFFLSFFLSKYFQ